MFVKHVVPAVVKPAHTLWNELLGFLFLSFGVILGFRAERYYVDHDFVRMSFVAFPAALMLWYGVSSFLKARKISRS